MKAQGLFHGFRLWLCSLPTGVFTLLPALSYLGFVAHDIPILRHDWPAIQPDFRSTLGALSGWSPLGMGIPVAYPSSFVLVLITASLTKCFGPYVAHVFVMTICALSIALGVVMLVRSAEDELGKPASRVLMFASTCFAFFNPWTYTETVAGHFYMLISFGGLMCLAGYLRRSVRDERFLIGIIFLVVIQIQYFFLALPFILVHCLKTRKWRALLVQIGFMLPILVGVIVNRTTLSLTPYSLAWEQNQSLFLQQALVLRGYFTGYDSALPAYFFIPALIGMLICSGTGLVAVVREKRPFEWAFLGLWLLTFTWALGSNGPIAGIFSWIVTHFTPSGLFRELYDLLAVTVIFYLLCAMKRTKYAAIHEKIRLATGMLFFAAWLSAPPARFWVEEHALPQPRVSAPPHSRFALLPAFQPLKFGAHGSGLDPDAYIRADDVTPLNETLPVYPNNVALSAYLKSGEVDKLEALSVATVVNRPWLREDHSAPNPLHALSSSREDERRLQIRTDVLRPLPEMTLQKSMTAGALDNAFGSGNVFFSDATSLDPRILTNGRDMSLAPKIYRVRVQNTFVDAAQGWVDAHFAFAQAPELGQAFGGALTTSSRVALALQGRAALVSVQGRLKEAGSHAILDRDRAAYHWLPLSRDRTLVMCEGRCVIALTASALPTAFSLNPRPNTSVPLEFETLLPWLVVAKLPAGGSAVLRYNVRFDEHWSAYLHGRSLAHVRLDTIVNGWALPRRSSNEEILVIETGAFATAVAEVLCLALLVGVGATFVMSFRRQNRSGGHLPSRV